MSTVFVRSSKRAKAYTRRKSIKTLYKSYMQSSDEHHRKFGINIATPTGFADAKSTRRFNALYKEIQRRGLNPTKVIAGLSTGKYKLR
jgi:hypothetical protein